MDEDFRNSVMPALEEAVPGGVYANAYLQPLVRWRIGGCATALVEPSSEEEVAAVLRIMADRPEPLFVMGDASNLLFDSAGFAGLILRISGRMSQAQIEGRRVTAEAGIWVPRLARMVAKAGLAGIEHVVGIPGTLGGLVLMNGGSQRKGIGLHTSRVHCLNSRGDRFALDREGCSFSYRRSALQTKDATVVCVELELERGDPAASRREMISIMASRRTRFPKNLPNGGSTFLSDPSMYGTVGPPGEVIDKLGLKGLRRGGAQISPQHANFIVNTGGASSDDVLWLIQVIRQTVFRETGYLMECEVRHVAPDGRVRPANEVAEELFGLDL